MGAQDEAQGKSRGVLCVLSVAGLRPADQAFEGSRSRDQALNYLLDTNVVSEWVKPRPNANVMRWLAEADEDQVCLSVLTLAEIQKGVESMAPSQRRDAVRSWVQDELLPRFELAEVGFFGVEVLVRGGNRENVGALGVGERGGFDEDVEAFPILALALGGDGDAGQEAGEVDFHGVGAFFGVETYPETVSLPTLNTTSS